MHIAMINLHIEYYSPVSGGAIATVLMEQARCFTARGHRVSILTPVNGDPVYSHGEVVPVRRYQDAARWEKAFTRGRAIFCESRRARYGVYAQSLTNALQHLNPAPDVVVVQNDLDAPAVVRAALPKVKIYVALHNEMGHLGREAVHSACVAADGFIAVSGYIRDWSVLNLAMPTDRTWGILNGTNTETFHPAPGYLNSTGLPRILFLGRIDYWKGPDLLVNAARRLKDEGLEFILTVAGAKWWYGNTEEDQDPYVCTTRALANEVGAHVKGHVPRAQVPDLYRDHDIVCIPSRCNEAAPLGLLESLASGCASVASMRGAMPEVAGDAGVFFEPNRPESLVKVLRELVVNPETLGAYKLKAVDRAKELTWDRNVQAHEALFGHGTH